MSDARSPASPVQIFISYSHLDERWRKRLMTFLAPLTFQNIISGWHDRKIVAGESFASEIDKYLNSADIILLLVSADFLASGYCYDVEMKRALERHSNEQAQVIPIILSSCNWEFTPLRELQALPTDARPINTWRDKDRAFKSVVEGILIAIDSLKDTNYVRDRKLVDPAFYKPSNKLPRSSLPFVSHIGLFLICVFMILLGPAFLIELLAGIDRRPLPRPHRRVHLTWRRMPRGASIRYT